MRFITVEPTDSDRDRFFRHVNKSGPVKVHELGKCWQWLGKPAGNNGYGAFFCQRKRIFSHRLSFFLAHGEWPKNFCCHKCDNPMCVNPLHLYDGTHAQNMRDKVERGRCNQAYGEQHHQARLTKRDVSIIRAAVELGFRQYEIADLYGVSRASVTHIHSGLNWPSVRFPEDGTAERNELNDAALSAMSAGGLRPVVHSSKYRGVFLTKGIWGVRFKKRHIGVFRSETEAAEAYDAAAFAALGSDAILNFIPPHGTARKVLFPEERRSS